MKFVIYLLRDPTIKIESSIKLLINYFSNQIFIKKIISICLSNIIRKAIVMIYPIQFLILLIIKL